MSDMIRVINGAEVARLLSLSDCVALMARTFVAISAGQAELPLRMAVQPPGTQNRLGLMPGYLAEPAALGVKVVTIFPGGASHPGFILLFDPDDGAPLAMVSASEVTALRTAAASAAATQILANPGDSDLAILGTGTQAAAHLRAMALVRPLSRVRLWGRSPAKAQAFAEANSDAVAVPIEIMPSAQAAVKGAGLICTTTSSPVPVVEARWVAPGAHVNLVGSSIPSTTEADAALVAMSSYFVDYRPSAIAQAGELKLAIDQGLVTLDHIRGEIGQVYSNQIPGRQTASEITVFKSLGNAAQDLASARWIHDRATQQGIGVSVEI